MADKYNHNLGALIDLSQIKDGQELKRIIKEFSKLEAKVDHKINVKFNDRFNKLEGSLTGNLETLRENYADELKRLDEHIVDADKIYVKKTDLIGIDNLDENLRKILYNLIVNSGGDTSGFITDNNGELKKVKWIMYFILPAGNEFVYLDEVKNKSAAPEKTISLEDWYGEYYESGDVSGGCVEVFMYNRPAESYLPLFYLPVTGNFDNSLQYYYKVNNLYKTWEKINYNPDTWETDKVNLYYFDGILYENELIDVVENNDYSKTYIYRELGKYNEDDAVDNPICGKVSYEPSTKQILFSNHSSSSRYLFKIIKYEY